MTLANSVFAKASVAFVALATVFVLAAPAQAQMTSEQMQAEIDRLTALIAQLTASLGGGSTGGSMSSSVCPYTWTRDLSQGSTGMDVMKLQQFLNSSADTRVAATGVGSAGMETEYYGPATAAAVSKMQTKYSSEILVPAGLVNPTGYFGPSTRAKANMLCVSAPSTGGDTGSTGGDTGSGSSDDRDLQGGAGSLDSVDLMSEYNNEEVGEGENDVEVVGYEIEADRASDIMITALTIDFSEGTAGSDLDDYIEEVTVMFDGEVIATFDVDEFDEDDDYDSTVSLGSNAPILRAGETGELVLAVSAVNNLDSGDVNDTWTVAIDEVRFRDGDNAVITSSTGDFGTARTFSLESFASASDLEVSFNDENDTINDERVIDIDDTNDTDGVEIFAMEVEIEGDSSVSIDEMPFLFTVTGATDVDALISKVELFVDGDRVGSENVVSTAATATTTFDNLDLDLDPGTYEFVIKADFNPTGDAGVDNGDTIQVDFGEVQSDSTLFDIEDENGDDVADADMTGSVTGGPHVIYDAGIDVEFVSVSENKSFVADESGEADKVEFKFVFDVTAFDGDAYLDKSVVGVPSPTASTDGQAFGSTSQATTGTTTTSAVITASDNNSSDTTHAFIIEEDDTRRFTVTVTLEAGIDGVMQIELTGINWGTDGSGASTADQLYNFNLDDFLTDIVSVNVF